MIPTQTCFAELRDSCYKQSIDTKPGEILEFSKIKNNVQKFQKELEEKYPWKTGECKNNKNCEYINEIKNPKIGHVEVLKFKERLRLIFRYLINIKELQNPIGIIKDINNITSLEFIAVSKSICKKCQNVFLDTYGYKYTYIQKNDQSKSIFICITCVINYITGQSRKTELEDLLRPYNSVIYDDKNYKTVKLIYDDKNYNNNFNCSQCVKMITSPDFKTKIDIGEFKKSINSDVYNKITSNNFKNSYIYGYIYQTYDDPIENYCLSCVVNFTIENKPMGFKRLNSHNTGALKVSKRRSPKRSKKRSSKRSNRRSHKRSKKRSPKRSKRRSPKRSKRSSRKKSK
jgi:hypothetical protein